MNALRILASPKVWLSVVGVAAVLALVFFAYLAAVASPEENLEDLPVALVNEDRGAELAGEEVHLGDRVAENVTAPDSPAADSALPLFGGGSSAAAGLEDAVWVLAAYLVGAALLGYAVSLLKDLVTRRGVARGGRPVRTAAKPSAVEAR